MKRFIASLAITAMITLSLSLGLPSPGVHAQTATYSCGTYGSGNYSTNGDACTASDGSVAAPNTGFATKLTEPAVAIPLGLSLLALIAGILLLVSKRRKKRMTFNS